ncbi:unnamed protein product [Moneuplotes crassus]|uniref:CCT domain-containing protein n=1 Tax=Euplotes crassus TaxID=5936 RepID=A0AAD1Y4Z3_EUPCR|nr:unnamed protein product [Moneuplotes crassus]
MDPYDTLFDLQEPSQINFGTPNLLAEENSHLPANAGDGNLQQNRYIDNGHGNSSLDEEEICRDQKLLNFDENNDVYYDQGICKDEELSEFMNENLSEHQDKDLMDISHLRVGEAALPQPRSLFEVENEDKKSVLPKGICIVLSKLSCSKYCFKEAIYCCKRCKTRTPIHSHGSHIHCCTKKRINKEEEKHRNGSAHGLNKLSRTDRLVGLLSIEERSVKVNRYLEKKRRRKWNKKINYHSRKKVADTRPRFKGRFVSVDQADEYNKRLREELQEKLRKERMFVTQKIDKTSGAILKTVYPNIEALNYDVEHLNTSDNDSHKSCFNLKHNNEVMTYIGDIPLEM